MTNSRSERLGLEPGSALPMDEAREGTDRQVEMPLQAEIAHSIAISLKRIADRMDEIASGTATIRIQNEF